MDRPKVEMKQHQKYDDPPNPAMQEVDGRPTLPDEPAEWATLGPEDEEEWNRREGDEPESVRVCTEFRFRKEGPEEEGWDEEEEEERREGEGEVGALSEERDREGREEEGTDTRFEVEVEIGRVSSPLVSSQLNRRVNGNGVPFRKSLVSSSRRTVMNSESSFHSQFSPSSFLNVGINRRGTAEENKSDESSPSDRKVFLERTRSDQPAL